MADLIERSALLKELESIKNRLQMMDDTQTADKIMTGLFRATVCIKDAPAVDAVPVVHGRWKIKTVREYDLSYGRIYIPEYVCGCCGHCYESYVRGDEPIMPEDADFPMYCEQCGAVMDGKDGDADGRP